MMMQISTYHPCSERSMVYLKLNKETKIINQKISHIYFKICIHQRTFEGLNAVPVFNIHCLILNINIIWHSKMKIDKLWIYCKGLIEFEYIRINHVNYTNWHSLQIHIFFFLELFDVDLNKNQNFKALDILVSKIWLSIFGQKKVTQDMVIYQTFFSSFCTAQNFRT
jgi:hypothetical protein